MANTVCQNPAVDYFSLSRQQAEQSTSPFNWDSEPALVNSDSCDSILPSPTSPNPIFSKVPYTLPKENPLPASSERKGSTSQAFDFGTFEDWMRWDDPADAALSPTSDFFPELKLEPLSPTMSGLELSRNIPNLIPNTIDEAAVFGDDNMVENGEPLFQNAQNNLMSSPILDIPPREGLYSTPLSWSRPQMGNAIPQMRRSQTVPQPQQSIMYSRTLTPQEEIQLRAIAMPQTQVPSKHFPASPTSSTASPIQSPITRPARPINSHSSNSLKRKSSHNCSSDSNSDGEDEISTHSSARHPPIKKTAHNMIEKRYRTNLNDKIALLRDSVPSLRVMTRKCSRAEGQDDKDGDEDMEEDLQGLTPAHKLNKATVLSKATEYIGHLEKRNKHLQKENASLKSRIEAFEMLLMSQQSQARPSPLNPMQQQQQQQQQQQKAGSGNMQRGRY